MIARLCNKFWQEFVSVTSTILHLRRPVQMSHIVIATTFVASTPSISLAQPDTNEPQENMIQETPSNIPNENPPDLFLSDSPDPHRAFQVSGLLDIGSYGAFMFGAGSIVSVPVVKGGFIPGINEAFYVEGGLKLAGVFFSNTFSSFTQVLLNPMVGARWDFYFTETLSAYPLIRTGGIISLENGGGGFYFATGIGGHWRFSDPVSLRSELIGGSSSGVALSIGVSFNF